MFDSEFFHKFVQGEPLDEYYNEEGDCDMNPNDIIEKGNYVNVETFHNFRHDLLKCKYWNGKYYGRNQDIVYIDGIKCQLYV